MNLGVIGQLGMFFFMIGIGVLIRVTGLVDSKGAGALSTVAYNVGMPFMVFCSISGSLNIDTVRQAGRMLIIAVGLHLISFLISIPYVRLLKLGEREKGVHQFAVVFSNVAFIGLPVAKAFWGDEAVMYLSIFTVVFSFFNHSLGAMLLSGAKKLTFGNLFKSPPFIASIVGVIFGLCEIRVPDFIFTNLKAIGAMTTPLAMLFIGCTLGGTSLRDIMDRKAVFVTTAMRLLVIPALTYFVLRAVTSDYYTYAIPTVVAAMPCATTIPILAAKFGADVKSASYLIAITALGSVLTIPLLALILL